MEIGCFHALFREFGLIRIVKSHSILIICHYRFTHYSCARFSFFPDLIPISGEMRSYLNQLKRVDFPNCFRDLCI